MRQRVLALVSVIALAMGASIFAVPSTSWADVVITDIAVTNGTGGNFTGGAAGNTWTFSPITLAPGQSLVLAQNQADLGNSSTTTGLPGFNFDSTENGSTAAGQYTVKVTDQASGANSFTDTSGALNVNGNDIPASSVNNEAANWVKIGGVAGSYDLYVGYADTLHSADCLDGTSGTGTCLPFSASNLIWDGTGGSTAATHFLGNPSNIPGYAGTTTHCNVNQADSTKWDCWDSGALLIVSTVPEPTSVLLVATVIIGLMGWGLRRNRMAA